MRARERVRVIVRVFVSGCMPVLVRVCAREKATEKIDIVGRINSGHNRNISNPKEETQLIFCSAYTYSQTRPCTHTVCTWHKRCRSSMWLIVLAAKYCAR